MDFVSVYLRCSSFCLVSCQFRWLNLYSGKGPSLTHTPPETIYRRTSFRRTFICLAIVIWCYLIWRFPEIGVPPNHPFIDGCSMKSTIQTWECPQPLGNPQMSVSETCWLVVSTPVKNMRSSDWDDSSQYMGLSENSVPLNPMVLLIIIPTKWLFHWEYTTFSDIPIWKVKKFMFQTTNQWLLTIINHY